MIDYNSKEKLIELINVSKIFANNGHETCAVKDIDFELKRGDVTLLLGPSGSGKTTMLTLIAGLIQPSSGNAYLFSKDVKDYSRKDLQMTRAKKIGFVFQTFLLLEHLPVKENISMVLRFAGKKRKEANEAVLNLLRKLKIEYVLNKFPSQLSQGEKQRAAIARAIANEPDLILADEPTANLESKQGLEVIKLLCSYARESNKGVIIASHDLRIIDYADNVIRLEDGMILRN